MTEREIRLYRWVLRFGAIAAIAGLIWMFTGLAAREVAILVPGLCGFGAGVSAVRVAARHLIAGGGDR